jgi:hypothetical protein
LKPHRPYLPLLLLLAPLDLKPAFLGMSSSHSLAVFLIWHHLDSLWNLSEYSPSQSLLF